MLPKGSRVAVAVSGGADSVCLLHVLRELAGELEIDLSVAHFNHQLRGEESEQDERAVANLAASLGLRLYRGTANAAEVPGNLEEAARRARLAFFAELVVQHGVDRIALGHTRDDQAETVLFRFLRGTGLRGLSGIHPVTPQGCVRPLLEVTRGDVEDFLRSRTIVWREDSSNRDQRFARNRIRQVLLPQLTREWNPALGQSLAHMAEVARDEDEWWRDHIDKLAAGIFENREGGLEFRIGALAELPLAVRRRLIRRAVATVKGDLRGVDYRHFSAVLDLTERLEGHGSVRLPGDLAVRRSFDWVRIELPGNSGALLEAVPLKIPGFYPLPGGSVLHAESGRGADAPPAVKNATLRASELSLDRLPAGLQLRGWQAGDQYCPAGQTNPRKLKEMFQMARIPSWRRGSWPMVSHGTEIVWARGFGPALKYAAAKNAGAVVRIWEADPSESGGQ